MTYLYVLGIIPAVLAWYFAHQQFRTTVRRHRVPPAVQARFTPHLVGWGLALFILWFFGVSFLAQTGDTERITWLLLSPVAFAIGELIGLFAWNHEVTGFERPQPLLKE